MKKQHIFKTAHKIAKGIVKEVGNYQVALSLALKEVYRQIKLYDKKRFGNEAVESAIYRLGTAQEVKDFDKESEKYVYGIAKWFYNKEFTNAQAQMLIYLEDEKIVKENNRETTVYTVKIEVYGSFGAEMWLRSQGDYVIEYKILK